MKLASRRLERLDFEDGRAPQDLDAGCDFGPRDSQRDNLEGRDHVARPDRHMIGQAGKRDRGIHAVQPVD